MTLTPLRETKNFMFSSSIVTSDNKAMDIQCRGIAVLFEDGGYSNRYKRITLLEVQKSTLPCTRML